MKNKIVEKNFIEMKKNLDIDKKTNDRVLDIVNYLNCWNIKNVILGISGGIDSAFVLELLLESKKYYNFNIHTVFFSHEIHKFEPNLVLINNFLKEKDVNIINVNLSSILKETNKIDFVDDFTNAQFAYALMYTMLFRFAQKYNGVTFGTTNKDELSIGWFGKNSDMVVDIQPIHDFHKFEIYNNFLTKKIPEFIVKAKPDGNIISGKKDEDVFGCTYNEISSIINLKEKKLLKDDIMNDYESLKELLKLNNHKLIKDKKEFNPIFL